ncbi:MAG: hypothetical protein LC790_04560 [Actinobacteria bacterium]|nr:hypothetical protein [Actinomycetota bacterium]
MVGKVVRPDGWLLAFAASVFVFHQLPALAGEPAGDVIDVFTPVVVAATSAGLLLSLRRAAARGRGRTLGRAAVRAQPGRAPRGQLDPQRDD